MGSEDAAKGFGPTLDSTECADRGLTDDVEELITTIDSYVDQHNEQPKPFIWTAKASDILEKVKRARVVLDNAQSV